MFTLDARRAALPEWADYAEVPVELQVRAVLAHAWAAIGHELSYKSVTGISPKAQRMLAQVSAMLEATDTLFEMLRDDQDQYRMRNEELDGVNARLVRETDDVTNA